MLARVILKFQNMGKLALVDYSFMKEICDYIKRDGKKFTGKIKSNVENDEHKTYTSEKIDKIKGLLLSGKKRSEAPTISRKQKIKSKKTEKARFRQTETSSSSSDSSSSASGSYSDNDSDELENPIDDAESEHADNANDNRTNSV